MDAEMDAEPKVTYDAQQKVTYDADKKIVTGVNKGNKLRVTVEYDDTKYTITKQTMQFFESSKGTNNAISEEFVVQSAEAK